MLQMRLDPSKGQHLDSSLRPLDETNALAVEILLAAQLQEIGGPFQSIAIQMVDRTAPLVFIDDGEGGAVDHAGHSQAPTDALGQNGLAAAQTSEQGDHIAGAETAAQPLSQASGLLSIFGHGPGHLHRRPLYRRHLSRPHDRQGQDHLLHGNAAVLKTVLILPLIFMELGGVDEIKVLFGDDIGRDK
jgi:hypothetical protein